MTQQTSSPDEIRETLDFVVDPYSGACGCMGPQRDEPLCPCAMNSVIKWRGRWIKLTVLGGAKPADDYLAGLVPEDVHLTAEGQNEYDVILTRYESKIHTIRVVREITGLGLTSAKALVESLPKAVFEGCSRDEAMMIKAKLEAVGAVVDLK